LFEANGKAHFTVPLQWVCTSPSRWNYRCGFRAADLCSCCSAIRVRASGRAGTVCSTAWLHPPQFGRKPRLERCPGVVPVWSQSLAGPQTRMATR
jgi:hypothetical protein